MDFAQPLAYVSFLVYYFGKEIGAVDPQTTGQAEVACQNLLDASVAAHAIALLQSSTNPCDQTDYRSIHKTTRELSALNFLFIMKGLDKVLGSFPSETFT
jgi:hypothetical protein